jgi:NMD protein affecting ribosome stability and mRNA decay
MGAAPEGLESTSTDDTVQLCTDCGRPIEVGAGESFRVCRACYDAYVDNAGR